MFLCFVINLGILGDKKMKTVDIFFKFALDKSFINRNNAKMQILFKYIHKMTYKTLA